MARDDGTEAAATAAGSPKTVRNIHIALRRSLADALRFGLVPRNVATLVKPPSPIHAELSTWSAEEVRDFLAAVADDRLMPAYGGSLLQRGCAAGRYSGCVGPTSISPGVGSP